MTKRKDSEKLAQTKADLHRQTVHISQFDDGVIVFQFEALTREIFIPFGDYLRVQHTKWEAPVRLVLDFRGAGAPSRFMIDRAPRIFDEISLPEDTRIACLVDDSSLGHLIHLSLENWREYIPQMDEFLNFDPALNWLWHSSSDDV